MLHYENWTQMTERTKSIDHQMNDLLIAENKTYRLIIIFGVYLLQDTDPLDVSLMLDLANYARRSAKITHKSLTIKYDENMRQEELQERKLANVMHAALENNEFIPYFQPKYNMADHSIIGSEALVRWIDTKKEIQYPGSFIPFFEKNGFIVEMIFPPSRADGRAPLKGSFSPPAPQKRQQAPAKRRRRGGSTPPVCPTPHLCAL